MRLLVVLLLLPLAGAEIASWEEFKTAFNRTYRRSFRERRSRDAFLANAALVAEHNGAFEHNRTSFRLALNALADLNRQEYLVRFVHLQADKAESTDDGDAIVAAFGAAEAPQSVDWRELGFRPPADNQKSCGACYAFSIVHSIEGQIFKRTSKMIALSEQQIVDCSFDMGNQGCAGGSLKNTLRYLVACGGLMRQQDYPYTAKEGRCRFLEPLAVLNVSRWAVLPKSEAALALAVATVGPVAVSINAAPRSFQLYGDGVYDDAKCSSSTVNHAMLLVGYTPAYWILRNWWGERWGEGGYMRLKRHQNLCGVANYAAYALV
ncbi:procathepsin L-like [Phlebotomus argentipes]|uniref:procathepsin L-like n=1 Tax=Phlebotomus argentipes TaxID=94469 RepID=UPI0028929BAB|nr:procathepsin L-like [Phlebotomus argentipes]